MSVVASFKIEYGPIVSPEQLLHPRFKRCWTAAELVALFPDSGIDILDLGSGTDPFPARPQDRLITVDFDEGSGATYVVDFTKHWNFEEKQFDFIFASHVIEHLYPQDRDQIVCHLHDSLRENGLLFIRVPHWSSIQGTGWEHYTLYGTNGVTSLCHGQNPLLPVFQLVSTGVWMGSTGGFRRHTRSGVQAVVEWVLNKSFRLMDSYLCYLVGGVPEVQFLLRRLPAELERQWFDRG